MIVCDAAPLIYLSKVGRLELLKRLYGQVLIPQGVLNEEVSVYLADKKRIVIEAT